MFAELHIKSEPLLRGIRNRLKRINTPVTGPLPTASLPAGILGACAGEEVWLDHMFVWDGTVFERTDEHTAVVKQPIDIFLVARSALEQNGKNPSSPCWTGTVSLVFTLTFELADGQPTTSLAFQEIEGGTGVDQALVAAMSLLLLDSSSLAPEVHPLELDALAELFGDDPPPITRVGLSGPTSAGRIALRLEFELPPSLARLRLEGKRVAAWEHFFNGQFLGDDTDRDWSFFLHELLLEQGVRAQLRREIDANDDFNLETGPYATFLIDSTHRPWFRAAFSGEQIDACVCFAEEIDLDVDVDATLRMRAVGLNQLELTMELELTLNYWEVFCCGLTAAFLFPVIGPALLEQGDMNEGEFAGGLVGHLLGFLAGFTAIATGVAHGKAEEKLDLGTDFEKISDDPLTFRNVITVDFGDQGLGEMTLDSLVGHNLTAGMQQGTTLGGTLEIPAEVVHPVLDISVSDEWIWEFEDACAEDPRINATCGVNIGREPVPASKIPGPLRVYRVEVVPESDPANQFAPFLSWSGTSITFVIPVNGVKIGYRNAPYQPELLVVTNAGVRILRLPMLLALGVDEIDQMLFELETWQVIGCNEWLAIHGFWKGSKVNPVWLIDPPPDQLVARFVHAQITGLTAGHVVTAVVGDEPVALATSGANNVAQLRALVPAGPAAASFGLIQGNVAPRGAQAAMELSLASVGAPPRFTLAQLGRTASTGGSGSSEGIATRRRQQERNLLGIAKRDAQQRLAIHEVVLIEEARIERIKALHSMTIGQIEGRELLIVGDGDQLGFYALDAGDRPRLIHQKRLRGMLGATAWRQRVLAWGCFGLGTIDSLKRRPVDVAGCGGVRAVAAAGGMLAALGERGLLVFKDNLECVQRLPEHDGAHLAVHHRTIAIGDRERVSFFRRDRARLLEPLGAHQAIGVDLIVPTAGPGDAYYLRAPGGSAEVVSVTRAGNVEGGTHYPNGDAWLERRLKWRDSVLVHDRATNAIVVYRPWRSATTVR